MNKYLLLTALLFLIVGLLGGYWIATLHIEKQPIISAVAKQPLFYRNPMDPSITSPVPAKDNMGMDYVPVYSDNAAQNDVVGTVKIDAVTEQNIGVRTDIARRETLSHIVHAVGRVAYDEERLVRLHPKTEGWIETLNIDKTGQWVDSNDDLLSIYSPQLVTSQQEYILALRNLKALEKSPIEDIRRGAEELVKSSLERLKLLDVPAHQMHDLTRTQKIKKSLHIHSPSAGIIMNIGAREGQYVTPATELYMIADLSSVWVYANVYEYELPWVKVGDPVEMNLAGVPGRTFKGQVAYIYPYAEPKTRTIKVRLTFNNAEFLLKPDMFAEVTIYAGIKVVAVTIPSEAVIRSGVSNKVFVMRAPGKFEPRSVKVGFSSSGRVAVLEGIKAGEKVVTSAQFLLDSESKLREVAAKMMEPKKSVETMDMNHMSVDKLPTKDNEMEMHHHEGHQHD